MSTLDEKLEDDAPQLHTRARRRLDSLVGAWGYRVLEQSGGRVYRVEINVAGMKSTWRRVEVAGAKAGNPWFEKEE